MRLLAKQRGGKCLSTEYRNVRTKLLWKCRKGHEWAATPDNVKRGSWCPTCARASAAEKLKLSIEEMQSIARQHGGECLSTTYVNTGTKLRWRCKHGHRWQAVPGSIKKGHWCPICRRHRAGKKRRLTLEEMQEIAKNRGGKCLSENYEVGKKLKWQCKNGHVWEATPSKIKFGTWCPICGNITGTKKRSLTIESMQKLAADRGGECLSKEYVNSQTNLLWGCKYGHQWRARPNAIRLGSWCPECTAGLGEKISREFFEQIFKRNFPRAYPKWLVNEESHRMELDGYCPSLKLAFEHQGRQHFSIKTLFINSIEELKHRKRDDRRKKELCAQKGILLIQIPEVPSRLPVHKIKGLIKQNLQAAGLQMPESFDSIKVDLNSVYASNRALDLLTNLNEIAISRGGRCLSEKHMNAFTKLRWECGLGHQWEALPGSIKKGHWCPTCSGRVKLTIDEMHDIAKNRGGTCLSTTYINFTSKLKWKCKCGHTWYAAPASIKAGRWCPICGRKKSARKRALSIIDMKRMAKERGGKCLSDEYININTKLLWECHEGHQWWAIPYTVKKGHWCPICARVKKSA